MKKITISKLITYCSMTLSIILLCLLTGCGAAKQPTEGDLMVDEQGYTACGIHQGSTYKEFVNAYADFYVQRVIDDQSFEKVELTKVKEKDEVLTDDTMLMVSSFFIDGEGVSTADLIKSLSEEEGEALSGTESSLEEVVYASSLILQSDDYLSKHRVTFRYALFEIKNNCVNSITSDYLDYNSELLK